MVGKGEKAMEIVEKADSPLPEPFMSLAGHLSLLPATAPFPRARSLLS